MFLKKYELNNIRVFKDFHFHFNLTKLNIKHIYELNIYNCSTPKGLGSYINVVVVVLR